MTAAPDVVDVPPAPVETTACPLCGSNDAAPYLTGRDLLHGVPGVFAVVRCRHCHHAYTNPRPTRESIHAYYPDDYQPFHLEQPGAAAEPARRLVRRRRWLDRLLEPRAEIVPPVSASPRRALEIGCADGRFLERLAADGWEAEGVEPSPAAAARARALGLKVHCGTLESAGFPDGRFDAVFLWHVLEHLHDPRQALHEIHRILKPGGHLAFSLPNFGCWERRFWGHYWYALDLPRHLQHFTAPTLRSLLHETGFGRTLVIHQRSALNLTGSLGLFLRERFPRRRWGARLLLFTENPRAAGLLLLMPVARLLAGIRQAGRLTVTARREDAARARDPR